MVRGMFAARLALAACLPVLVLPAHADRQAIAASRTTALEIRKHRKEADAKAEQDGFSPLPRAPRIIGGSQASAGEYPWMVALAQADVADNHDAFFCGGSLIHPYWILTASHCVIGSKPEDLEVVLGTTNLDNPAGAQRIAVAEIVMSPKYNDFTLDGDFALLRLAEPANASLTTLPLIDTASLALPGTLATVTGWGDTTNGEGSYPARLQEVQLPIVDLAVANATAAYQGSLTENMLPAGRAEGGKDSCSGDSGGPLIVPAPLGPGWMQAGIVSFGAAGCGLPGNYGVYSRVEKFRRFILGHILPNYAAWEIANNRSGELRDPDANGFTNFEDFALPGHALDQSTSGGFLRLSYLRPALAGEVDYILENAPSAGGPWTVKSLSTSPDVVQEGPDLLRWTLKIPQAEVGGVYRVRAKVARRALSGPRLLEYASGVSGHLDPASGLAVAPPLEVPGYRLSGLVPGQEVALTLRSPDFDAALELVDATSFVVLATSNDDHARGVAGFDEELRFTPQAGASYIARIAGGDAGGDYELNLWNPGAYAALPGLEVPLKKARAVKGRFTVDDAYDPFFLPAPYPKDDLRLSIPSAASGKIVELRMKSADRGATGVDDVLELIDAETGRMLAANDTFSLKANDAGLRFMPIPGKAYTLRATTSVEDDLGAYAASATLPKLSPKTPLATLAVGASAKGKVGRTSEFDEHYYVPKRDYLLGEVAAGSRVFVTLESSQFDAYLMVLDATTLLTVAEGDGGGPAGGLHNARAEFTAEEGKRYLLRAMPYEEGEAGAYVIRTGLVP